MNNSETKKACSIADIILKKVIEGLRKKKFKTEMDVFRFLREETYKRKCRLSFKPIVAMGKNAVEIHHKPNDTKLKKGFLVIDFGVKYKDYCSDCTRTFYIGKPSREERKLYNLVKIAQETALIYATPGNYAADVDLIARAVLWDYFKNFVHGTGHGVGKRIHQAPSLKPRSRSVLKKGQAITIEPGLYFKNKFGIRIEDTLIVKERPVVLTKIKKKLIII